MFDNYIGIDLHKSFFHVCAMDPHGARRWEQQWPMVPEAVEAFLGRCAGRSAVAVEASGPTWAFADQIVDHVQQLQIVDPRKTRLKAGYAAKTDRLDARRLADALRRQSVVAVYYPPQAIRNLRELCRYRRALVRMRTGLKQRLHALLVRHGITLPRQRDLFGISGQQWLTRVAIDGWGGVGLRGLVDLYRAIEAQLTPLEQSVREHARQDPIACALDRIPGLGSVLALTIRSEIGSIERFARPAQLASYAGVVPRVAQSGRTRWHGPITKEGSPWLRWALIEAAIHGVRRHDAVGAWARQLAMRRGGLKARVAVARALCHEIFHVWRSVERLSGSAIEVCMATP